MCAPCRGSVFRRQELEQRALLKLYQNWDERFEDHLTLRQEEGEGRPAGKPLLAEVSEVSVSGAGACPDHTADLMPTTAPCPGPRGDFLASGS